MALKNYDGDVLSDIVARASSLIFLILLSDESELLGLTREVWLLRHIAYLQPPNKREALLTPESFYRRLWFFGTYD